MTRRTAVGTGVLVAAGVFLMQLAWMLTMPAATGIDEFDHIHRAGSVASGHWSYNREEMNRKIGRGALIPVPKDIVAASRPACETFIYVGPANCSAYGEPHGDLVMVADAAARYNPLFYAAIGYPASLFHGASALVVMRLVAAVLSAVMVGLGALVLRTWTRTGWPLVGLFLACTPTVIYSSSIAAPNGLSIVSGLTLWAALLGLVHGPDDRGTRRLLMWTAAIASVTMVNTHTLGMVWLVLILVAVALHRGSLALPRVPRSRLRHAGPPFLVALAGLVFEVVWVLLARTNSTAGEATAFHQPWWHETLTIGVPLWPLQAIAAFPLRDEPAPVPVYAIGISLMLAVAIASIVALVRGRNRSALLAIAFVAVMSYVVPLVLTAVSFHAIGLAWQGRYEMQFTGGLLLLFGLALDQARARLPVPIVVSVMALLGLMNVIGQLRIIRQFDGSKLAQTIGWQAPSPVVLGLLAAGFAVLGSLAVTGARSAAVSDRGEPPGGSPAPVHELEQVPVP